MKKKLLYNRIYITPIIWVLFTLLIVTSFQYASAKEQDIPDIATFMKIGNNDKPQHNRTTGEVFFESKMSGTRQIYRINNTGWPYQLTVFGGGVDWYRLSYDGTKTIVGASTDGSEQSQLYLMDSQSGKIRQLTDNPKTRYGSITWKKDGSGYYYRSNIEKPRDFRIYFHNLNANLDTKLLDMEGSNSIGDLSYDGKYLVIYHYHTNIINDLFLLNIETGEYEQITPEGRDSEYSFPALTVDNKYLYIVCNNNKDGIMKPARINISTKEIEFLNPQSQWTVDVLTVSDNRKYIAWLVNMEGYSRIELRDTEKDEILPAPSLDGRIRDLHLTNDGRLYFSLYSPTKTKDIWLWDWRNEELQQITFATYAGIDPNIFINPTLIKYKSFDGLEIPAFLYLPPDYNNEPIPFIINAHGGPESQFRPYFNRSFQYFLLNGFGILAPNIRGSSGYGKKYVNLDNYKNRLNSIKDIKVGVDYLIENKYTAEGKIGIMGGSYGGYVVLATITEYPNLMSAAVNRVGIANFVTFLKNTKDYRRHIRESEYGPLTDEAFLESISPIHKAHHIKTPLLVIHGENDTRVPVGEARQIIKAIHTNRGIVDSLIFPDEGHIISKRSNLITTYRKIVEFFEEHLKKSK